MKNLTGNTKILGIMGDPVAHSLSPVMQNAALAASDLDYVYIPFHVNSESLENAVLGFRAIGVHGFNVTIPHKTSIISYLDRLDESAESAGAVNTVLLNDGHLTGYNTDGDGLIMSLSEDLNFKAGTGTIVIIGAGGAARGAVAALCRAGAAKIVILNRSLERAVKLAEEISGRYPETSIISSNLNRDSNIFLASASLLVNTTSIGMKGETFDFLDLSALPDSAAVYDMVYSPLESDLLNKARKIGIPYANGLGMLAAQGELAFEIWTGIKPPKGLMKLVLTGNCRS